MDYKVKEFLDYMLNNKSLTNNQKNQITNLIIRDLSAKKENLLIEDNYIKGAKSNVYNLEDFQYVTWHNPQNIVNLLSEFSGNNDTILKYITHGWDKVVNTDEYLFKNFDDFKSRYLKVFNQHFKDKTCVHIWQLMKNFLDDDDAKYYWSKYHLKVGYNKYLREWMNENPGKQPLEMPLFYLKEDLGQNQLIEGKRLAYFMDVVTVFKHCIEFRDNDLYYTIKRVFRIPDHILDEKAFDTVRGRSFYTDTEVIEDVLSIISNNIATRPSFPNVVISCKEDFIQGKKVICLEILQKESFSNKNITDVKIRCEDNKSDLGRIKENLKGLCDFAIESQFRVNGELMPLRINYLMNNDFKKNNYKGIEKISENECKGFKYILIFYK